jgi:hypothetical protein
MASSKFLGNFKLPKFDGTARHWKVWDKNFVRFLSIHQLDHVIAETFLDMLPLTPQAFQANKMVYYILEDAIILGSLAAKYLRLAAKWNGNEAYVKLHDGYVFSGPQTMAILLAELVNLRFLASESASGFCLRLRELFEDLEMVPGSSAIAMNDTQKIGYLLSGIRQEKPLQVVYVALQDKQVRGEITFDAACEDLHLRCEAIRVDEFLSTPVRDSKLLVSTQSKRQNKGDTEIERGSCLEKGCQESVKIHLPLCLLHYHQCVSGKCPEVELKDGFGIAKFDTNPQRIVYPASVPTTRLPKPRSGGNGPSRKMLVSAGLMNFSSLSILPQMTDGHIVHGANAGRADLGIEPNDPKAATTVALKVKNPGPGALPLLLHVGREGERIEGRIAHFPTGPTSSLTKFYLDSGVGQCLCSCSSAFTVMEPCHMQVIGVAGMLSIHGHGTAVFLVSVDGCEALLRIHNCLFSFGEFNLISISQLNSVSGNSIDFSLQTPFVRFSQSSQPRDEEFLSDDPLDVPLEIEDGLYSLSLEPITPSDPRFSSLVIFDITPQGPFVPLNHMLRAVPSPMGAALNPIWTTTVLSASPSMGRVLAMNSSLDFDDEPRSFSDNFLAPAAIPPSRRQYDVSNSSDMTELSIRFMGAGADRIVHTVDISNGLEHLPSKAYDRIPPKLFPQGNLKRSKTPVVTKGKVGNLHTAGVELVEANFFLRTERWLKKAHMNSP